jgi:hypothetical protein
LPAVFGQYFDEHAQIGELREVGDYEEILHPDLMREAYCELEERRELQEDVQRATDVAKQLGY